MGVCQLRIWGSSSQNPSSNLIFWISRGEGRLSFQGLPLGILLDATTQFIFPLVISLHLVTSTYVSICVCQALLRGTRKYPMWTCGVGARISIFWRQTPGAWLPSAPGSPPDPAGRPLSPFSSLLNHPWWIKNLEATQKRTREHYGKLTEVVSGNTFYCVRGADSFRQCWRGGMKVAQFDYFESNAHFLTLHRKAYFVVCNGWQTDFRGPCHGLQQNIWGSCMGGYGCLVRWRLNGKHSWTTELVGKEMWETQGFHLRCLLE